jgi:hypothetical protein
MKKLTSMSLGETIEIKKYTLPDWVEAMYHQSQHNPDGLQRELAYGCIGEYLPYIRFNQSNTSKNESGEK